MGLGVYHSGVEINGREYSFGGSPEMSTTGVFDQEPLSLDQDLYRESIELGEVERISHLYDVLRDIKEDFPANEYNVIKRNCNHFADEFWKRLLGVGIPGYINRLANIGICCSCLIPEKMLNSDPVTNTGGSEASSGSTSAGKF